MSNEAHKTNYKGFKMSAFIVSEQHINAILTASITCPIMNGKSLAEINKIGKMLWNENHKSVNYRYKDSEKCPPYKFKTWFTCYAQAVKLLDCLDYQSCEHNSYEDSKTKKFIDELKIQLKTKALLESPRDYEALYNTSHWSI